MLKRKLCEATFEWALHCDGPLLIADGRYQKPENDKVKGSYPTHLFVSHNRAEEINNSAKLRDAATLGFDFYVPGTSLRGPFRAQAERIIRSLLPESAIPPATACDPFEKDKGPSSCSKRLEGDHNPTPYARACPACRLFGCTGTASRIRFTDAEIPRDKRVSVYRDMIGIDRFTGGVFQGEIDERTGKRSGGANMRLHALEQTSFTTTVSVTNFELWQLGLLAFVFRDFADGLVPIGYGKTKGFGSVIGTITTMTLTYPLGKCGGKVQHVGSLISDAERTHYGFHDVPAIECDGLQESGKADLRLYETITITDLKKFWAAVAPVFLHFIETKLREATS